MIDTKEPPKPVKRRRTVRQPQAGTAQSPIDTGTASAPSPKKPAGKSSLVLDLLQRSEGATIAQLAQATGWLPHTTRAALTGLKKKGHSVTSTKAAGEERVYRVAAG